MSDGNGCENSQTGSDVKCNTMKFWVHTNNNSTAKIHDKRINVELMWKVCRLIVKESYIKKRTVIVDTSVPK